MTLRHCTTYLFLSTLSLRRATKHSTNSKDRKRNFYPRSPCGERLSSRGNNNARSVFLSTLSLRRATADYVEYNYNNNKFLSTLSLRRATRALRQLQSALCYFYPRSPCGERPAPKYHQILLQQFLSTLSLRRATCLFPLRGTDQFLFLSTLSLRRATLIRYRISAR